MYCSFGDKAKVAYIDTRDIGAVVILYNLG